jgi:hypothetical protein
MTTEREGIVMTVKRLTAKKANDGYSIFYGEDQIGFTMKMDNKLWETTETGDHHRFYANTRGDAMEKLLARWNRKVKTA